MIKPTNGRIVWFHPAADDNSLFWGDEEPLAAIVTWVYDDRCINVCAFSRGGTPHPRQAVRLLQGEDSEPGFGAFATWMPYQVGQAKKHATEDAAKA